MASSRTSRQSRRSRGSRSGRVVGGAKARAPKQYIRFQPPGLGLKHTSEGSDTALPAGFVFAYDGPDEALWGEWTPFSPGWQDKPMEVLTFTGRDEYDPGDAEGVAVRPHKLLRRETPADWLRRMARFAKDPEHRRYAALLGRVAR